MSSFVLLIFIFQSLWSCYCRATYQWASCLSLLQNDLTLGHRFPTSLTLLKQSELQPSLHGISLRIHGPCGFAQDTGYMVLVLVGKLSIAIRIINGISGNFQTHLTNAKERERRRSFTWQVNHVAKSATTAAAGRQLCTTLLWSGNLVDPTVTRISHM